MLFYSFFKSLVGKEVTVELKNDLGITGQLHSVDQYLNIKLNDIYVTEQGPVTIRKTYDKSTFRRYQITLTTTKKPITR